MLLTRQNPGVHITEAQFGPLPVEETGFQNMYLVGTALRGPDDKPRLVTSPRGYHLVFGNRTSSSYLDDAVRAIFETLATKVYIQRVVGAGAVKASTNLIKAGPANVIKVDAKGKGADYNYSAVSAKKGIAITYKDGTLFVYDYSSSVDATLPKEV